MSLSMYQASVPVFVQILAALAKVLDKAEAHAAAKKIDPAVLLGCRLAPDMFPLHPPGADRLRLGQGRRGAPRRRRGAELAATTRRRLPG